MEFNLDSLHLKIIICGGVKEERYMRVSDGRIRVCMLIIITEASVCIMQ